MTPLPTRLGRLSFYDGTPGRGVVRCPDCGQWADELFGDHGGQCIASVRTASPTSALGIIRAHALRHREFSMNDLRQQFIGAGIRKSSRGPALVTACKRQWIEAEGSVPSNDPATKRHRIQLYRSLIFTDRPSKLAAAR